MDLKDDIEGLSSGQIARINKNDLRVICNKDETSLTRSSAEFADDVHDAIEALSEADFNDLNDSLVSSRKLSGRPC